MENITKVLEVFFRDPLNSHYFREIQRTSGVSPNTLQKLLKQLCHEGLLIKEKSLGSTILYKADIENPLFITKKRVYNYKKLLESGVIEFLAEKYSPIAIILFGSFKDGRDIYGSDIDLYLHFKKPVKTDTKGLENFEKTLFRKVNLHTLHFRKMPEELQNNIVNGFTIYGFLKVF